MLYSFLFFSSIDFINYLILIWQQFSNNLSRTLLSPHCLIFRFIWCVMVSSSKISTYSSYLVSLILSCSYDMVSLNCDFAYSSFECFVYLYINGFFSYYKLKGHSLGQSQCTELYSYFFNGVLRLSRKADFGHYT